MNKYLILEVKESGNEVKTFNILEHAITAYNKGKEEKSNLGIYLTVVLMKFDS